jgi:hypothetical protein
MRIRQLMAILGMMNPEAEVFVALFNADGTEDTFDIEDVTQRLSGNLGALFPRDDAASLR